MRFGLIFIGVLALFGLYGGYWFTLADRAEKTALEIQQSEAEAGHELAWDSFEMTGFPYHIRAEIAAPRWRDKTADITWQTEALAVHGSPADPSRVIVQALHDQTFTMDSKTYLLQSDNLRVSAGNFGARLPNISSDGEGLKLSIGEMGQNVFGAPATAARAKLHLRTAPSDITAVDVAVDVTSLKSPVPFGPGLGQEIEKLDIVATISSLPDEVLNTITTNTQQMLNEWAAGNGNITIAHLNLVLPQGVTITAQGKLHAGRDGYPAGTLNAKITGYDVLLAIAVQAGALDMGNAQITRLGLDLADGMDGEKDGTVALPLTLMNGAAYLGPIKLADLPLLFPAQPDAKTAAIN